ncbi:MAG: two-component system chemotaxis response regulator CheB [Planctomycetota bacterium]|jgi:two-component system chemotaxis response regulator CheB
MSISQQALRVIIADDSAIYRLVLKKAISALPGIEIVGLAGDGLEALKQVAPKRADLILLDLEMPRLSGLQTLEEIRRRRIPVGVIIVSGTDMRSGTRTMSALRGGAFDFIVKPLTTRGQDPTALLRESLANAIRAFGASLGRSPVRELTSPAQATGTPASILASMQTPPPTPRRDGGLLPSRPEGPPTPSGFRAVVLAISTGGPRALAELLPAIPVDFPVPIYVTQHMPVGFTEHLAHSLDRDCPLSVSEGAEGQQVGPGQIVIAPGGYHMELQRLKNTVGLRLTTGPPENSCRPAADVMFRSASQVYGKDLLALVMTGMGHDGLEGTKVIRAAGGYCIAQHASTCDVNGMPGSVVDAGQTDEVVPLNRLAQRLQLLIATPRMKAA